MNYKELMEKSRDAMGTKLCKSCFVCDGKAVVTLYQDLALRVLEMLRCVTMMRGKIFV